MIAAIYAHLPAALGDLAVRLGGVVRRSRETQDEDLANFALAWYTTTFALNYKSIVGWTYTTVVSVNAGRIEIVTARPR